DRPGQPQPCRRVLCRVPGCALWRGGAFLALHFLFFRFVCFSGLKDSRGKFRFFRPRLWGGLVFSRGLILLFLSNAGSTGGITEIFTMARFYGVSMESR